MMQYYVPKISTTCITPGSMMHRIRKKKSFSLQFWEHDAWNQETFPSMMLQMSYWVAITMHYDGWSQKLYYPLVQSSYNHTRKQLWNNSHDWAMIRKSTGQNRPEKRCFDEWPEPFYFKGTKWFWTNSTTSGDLGMISNFIIPFCLVFLLRNGVTPVFIVC